MINCTNFLEYIESFNIKNFILALNDIGDRVQRNNEHQTRKVLQRRLHPVKDEEYPETLTLTNRRGIALPSRYLLPVRQIILHCQLNAAVDDDKHNDASPS